MKILALLLLGTLAGNELAVGAFVHPALSRLPDAQHAAAAQGLARIYGKVGPFWYAATLLVLIFVAWRTSANGAAKLALIASAALVAISIVFTIVGPVPINNRVAAWNLDDLPPNWKADRVRWDKLHAIRVVILLVSLIALAFGATRK